MSASDNDAQTVTAIELLARYDFEAGVYDVKSASAPSDPLASTKTGVTSATCGASAEDLAARNTSRLQPLDGVIGWGVPEETDDWLNTIWEAIDFEDVKNVEETVDTVEILPPATSSAADKAGGSVRNLLDYELNISPRDPRELGSCTKCKKDLAVIVLHGNSPQIREPRVLDITCVRCWLNVDESVPLKITVRTTAPWSRKRKGHGSDEKVWCDMCRHLIAYGGMRMKTHDSGWHAPDFDVEFLCANCVPYFNNCTDCGTGGRYRSGKWRPREMFSPGRKTCQAPHIRRGSKRVLNHHAVTYSMPPMRDQINGWNCDVVLIGNGTFDPVAGVPDSERALRFGEFFLESYKKRWMNEALVANLMRTYPAVWTWKLAEDMINKKIESLKNAVMGWESKPPQPFRKLCAIGYAGNSAGDTSPDLVSHSVYCWYLEGNIVASSLSTGITPNYDVAAGKAVVRRIEMDCERYGFQPPRFFFSSQQKSVVEMDMAEYDLVDGCFINLKKYCRDRCINEDEVRAELRERTHCGPLVDDPRSFIGVLPWEDRENLR